MSNPLPLKNRLAYAALAGAVALSAGGQDLMEKFEAPYPIGRWYLQVKKGTKEQGLGFFPCQENISRQRPVHKSRASCCLCNHHVPWGCRPGKSFQTPDHNTQTHLAGGEKGAEIASTAAVVCSDLLTFPTGAHIPPSQGNTAIRITALKRTGSAAHPPTPSSPPAHALIWSKFSAPRSCQIDSKEFLFVKQT